MLLRSTIFLTLSIFAFFAAKGINRRLKKEDVYKNGRMDVALKSKDHKYEPVKQNQCPDGWKVRLGYQMNFFIRYLVLSLTDSSIMIYH